MMQYSFLILAVWGAVLSGIALAILSPFVTLKRIAYMGEALSHIAFAGIALALLLGLNLGIVTTIFVLGVSALIGVVSRYVKTDETNVVTIFLSVAMALGIILIALRRNYTFDLASYLFGNVLLVSRLDIAQLGGLVIINAAFVILCFKELFYMTYNMAIAEVFGIKVKRIYYGLLLLLAVNIVVVVKIAGIILVTAQLVLPASIAFRLTHNLKLAIVNSMLIAVSAALAGFALSWMYNLPTGAVIVMVEFALYLISLLYKQK